MLLVRFVAFLRGPEVTVGASSMSSTELKGAINGKCGGSSQARLRGGGQGDKASRGLCLFHRTRRMHRSEQTSCCAIDCSFSETEVKEAQAVGERQ